MQAAGPATVHDRAVIATVYSAISAAVSLSIAFPHYAPSVPSLLYAREPFGNGLAGGIVAGLVAIAMFKTGRRAESREKKLVPARALVMELNETHDIMQSGRSALPPAFSGDEKANLAPDKEQLASSAKPAVDHSHHETAGSGQPSRLLPEMPRRVYDGLVSSGGIFHLEANLQLRLNTFYGYVERGDHKEVDQLIRPLIQELARFRDANAPFSWSDLGWPPRRAMFVLRRWRKGRKKTRSQAGQSTRTGAGAPSS